MGRSDISRHRAGAVAVLSGVCGVLAASVAQAEVRFVPRIGLNATWVDNSTLADSGASKESELIGQASPGLRLIVDADRIQAFLDYQLQAIRFQNGSGDTEVFHQAELGTQWEALSDWLYVDVAGSKNQTVVDPTGPVNVDNMFSVGNLADATSGQITPMLQHKFRVTEIELSYTRGFQKYDKAAGPVVQNDISLDDSKNESAAAALRSTNVDAFLSWEATYRHDKVEYDLAETFQYDQALAMLGFRVSPGLRLLARGGKESDPRLDISKGGLDATFWQGGFEWSRGEKQNLRVLAGKRFFGNSYDASWRYTGRLLEFGASYNEMPTTQTQTHVIRGITAPVDDFPTQIDRDFSRITSDVYVMKRLDARAGMRGRITDVFVSVNSETRQYINLAGLQDKYQGFDILASRRLTARMRLDASGGFTKSNLREGDNFRDRAYQVTLARQIGANTDLTFAANRFERAGALRAYKVNWFEVGFTMSFGNADDTRRGGRDRQQTPNRRMLPTVSGRP
ncbi:MAG: TIGR03016 family PEP-CTERM system-associated outer membrane protein [Gammaproteobacteria bacterium]